MPFLKTDVLATDGVKSLKSYFLFAIIAFVVWVAFIISTVAFGYFSSQSAYGYVNPTQELLSIVPIVIIWLVLYIILYVSAILMLLGFMFGIRDLRRSQLNSAKIYAEVSHKLKIVVVGIIISAAIGYLILLAALLSNVSSTYSNPYATSSSSPLGLYLAAAILFLITLVLFVIGILEIRKMYISLASDIVQPRLGTAALLLLIGVGIMILSVVISILALLGGSIGIILLPLAGLIGLVGVFLIFLQYVFGYLGTNEAVPSK
jgi:hypothetical protein